MVGPLRSVRPAAWPDTHPFVPADLHHRADALRRPAKGDSLARQRGFSFPILPGDLSLTLFFRVAVDRRDDRWKTLGAV